MKIRAATSNSQRLEYVRQYSAHLLSQWLDRAMYWKIRSLAITFLSTASTLTRTIQDNDVYSSTISCIIDGMDQSKLKCPRYGYDRLTKALDRLFRPTLHLTCAYFHGYSAFLPLSDENLKKDSVTQCEIIMRGLSALYESLGRSNRPLGFHCQADNCYRECKNQYFINLLLFLQVVGIFRHTSCGFLRTGHSHEDVDMIFGQVSRLLRGKKFATPADLLALLAGHHNQSASATSQRRFQGASAIPYKLDQCALWKTFVGQLGIHWKGLRLFPLPQDYFFSVLLCPVQIHQLFWWACGGRVSSRMGPLLLPSQDTSITFDSAGVVILRCLFGTTAAKWKTSTPKDATQSSHVQGTRS